MGSPLATFVLKSLGLPLLVIYPYVSFLATDLGVSEILILYLVSVLVAGYSLAGHREWQDRRAAARVGAVRVPRVQGRVIGNIDILLTILRRFYIETPGRYSDELADQYGDTFDMGIFGVTVIWTRDPGLVRHVLTGETFHNFEKGSWFNAIFEDFLGSGIFNSDREMWKAHRAMNKPYFTKDRTSDFEAFSRHMDHLLEVIGRLNATSQPTSCSQNGAVDIQELLGRYTLDAATEFLMGGSLSTLSDVLPGATDSTSTNFLDAFNQVQRNCYRRSLIGDIWKLWELRGSINKAPMKVIDSVVFGLIERALARSGPSAKAADGDDEGTLLDALIQKTRDPAVLKDQVLNILLAARDTTQTTITNTMYMLARHPHVLKKLRGEIIENLGEGAVPTYDAVRGLTYLRATINEVLRLFPPVPFNISFALFNIQRRTGLWGKDALEFDPDRWLDERISYYRENPFIWTPFSAGPRLCLGQQFAYNEISLALVRLLQRYDRIELALDVQPAHSITNLAEQELLHTAQITLMFKDGLWVRLGEAKA